MAKTVSAGKRYKDSRERSSKLRDDLDAEIVKARAEGQTYNQIAEDIGLSVAWVQASLKRSGLVGSSQE